jgi:hypothetical protein
LLNFEYRYKVSKYSLNEEKLRSKFRQIIGFYYVSSITKEGIDVLSKKLIETTLQEKYMGEAVPEVWLTFENEVKKQSLKTSLVDYTEISEIASNSGIFEPTEILEAVRFLNDLGSLQYFENDSLKDKVIINPQWVVDVMACVVSVKSTEIIDGRLYRNKLDKIWKNYDKSLHNWILYLTEVFNLTFPVAEQNLNIVPCLLPDKEQKYDWPNITNTTNLKEFKVVYNFVYLPTGLFNRIQVRLYQYGDSSIIWKNGSYLRKNNHLAVLTAQTEKSLIEIKVQGIKPENIIFIIHEVIETLINESFHGIQYDYSFPCPDCVDSQSLEPCLFSSKLLRKAFELKAPFLQCNQFFHACSINELLAIMPIDGTTSLDRNLEYSFRGITNLKLNLKYDIFFWYCTKNNIDNKTEVDACDPLKIIEALKNDYKLSLCKSDDKIDKIVSKIKESKLILLGVSDEFATDELSVEIFELTKNIIKKNYILIELGKNGEHKWLENPIFASVCADYRVIMQNPKRFSHKLTELFGVIEKQLKDSKIENKTKKDVDVFISYRWSNSHDAVKKGTLANETSLCYFDPRSLVDFFKTNNITAWIDVDEASNAPGLFGEITKGLNECKLVVACLSNDYVKSQNCKLEFRFAHCSLKKPIIKAIVGLGDEWRNDEISFLAGNYPEVNFQNQQYAESINIFFCFS